MVFVISFIICLIITILGGEVLFKSAAGFESLPQQSIALIALSGGAIYLGIISSLVFDRFDKRFSPIGRVFSRTDLLIAAIISPIVFLAFYPLMRESQDPIIQCLVAYQNGFLFQNVTSRLRGRNEIT